MTLTEVIKRLRHKARNIKEKLPPEYFDECADYLEDYRWVPVSERTPTPEVEVEIAYRYKSDKSEAGIRTARAFYEDGTVHTEESMMSDPDFCDWCAYDEETDDYVIPEGWLEYVSFGEEYTVLDEYVEVVAWRKPLKYEEGKA